MPSQNAFGERVKGKPLYDSVDEHDRDNPEKRSQWMMRGRTAPKGQSAAALRLRAYQQKMTMRAQRAAALKAGVGINGVAPTPWVALGPAPLVSDQNTYGLVTGRSTAIAVDPSDTTGNTVFIAGASGGVWKSTNAANAVAANVTWTPVTDQQASLTAGAVSVKSDGSVVLVGTGEPDNAIDSYYGVGILRSTDHGSTWTLIPSADSGAHSFAGMGFTKFAWLPSSNTVVAAAADAFKGDQENLIGGAAPNWGMYLSTDGGQTWAYQTPTDNSQPISATDVTYNAAAGKFFASIQYHGVYSSTNGTSWTRLANQPAPTLLTLANCPTTVNFNNNLCPLFRGQLTTVPGRNEMYFWFVDGSDTDDGIWQSLDGGNTWTAINENGIANCGDSDGCGSQQSFYNLEISAVANGTGTDIYAGAVNLFKCNLAHNATACSALDPNLGASWLNLTHVYGCSTLSSVHPDEHGLDFMVVGGKDIIYFGNDGGVYRALDGFTGLIYGSCNDAGTNAFDNLNNSMGSMTQFVSFSVHPTSKDIVLGGTQDNGSPASATATTSSEFFTVLGGDGGYNVINPNAGNTGNGGDGVAGDEWFASLTDSVIGFCELGVGCNDNNFFLLAAPGQGIDQGAFYTPYILDPQDTDEVLIGTCQIWRGNTASTTFTSISPDFDTGVAGTCNGGEINQVHGLAAGGPKDANGFSKVVYAVTFGLGPAYGLGTGGEVWATTDAATTQMSNVTGTINSGNYALSSVNIDSSDATGKTAYIGVMGFGTPHVYKTTNAGGSWTDWSGSGGTALPDAPVNDVLVDSATGNVYASTDVGVFVSSTASASWTEVGTPAAPGATGYLPNVPTSALRIFNGGGSKYLRVSTYGRGIWQYFLSQTTPDFSIAVTATPSSTVVNQNVVWNGTLTGLNGYSNTVNLSCTAGAPGTCTISPNSFVPSASGTPFTVTVGSATTGSFSFTISGTDGTITHATGTETLTVGTDVAWTNIPPNSVTVLAGVSAGYSFSAAPVGGATFTGAVTFACANLPALTSCVFNPTAISAGAGTTPVSLTITTVGPNQGGKNKRPHAENRSPWLPLTLPLAGIVMLGIAGRRWSKYSVIASSCLALTLLGFLVACGSSSAPPISVTGVSGNPTSVFPNNTGWPNQTATFTATLANDSGAKGVTWAVNTANGGTIQATDATHATYTAPTFAAGLPATVTITATSVADPSKSNSASETLNVPTVPGTYPNISVTATATGGSAQPQTISLTVQ